MSKRYRANLDDHFVQQAGIVKLTSQIPTAHYLDIPGAGGRPHFRMRSLHISVEETDVRSVDHRE